MNIIKQMWQFHDDPIVPGHWSVGPTESVNHLELPYNLGIYVFSHGWVFVLPNSIEFDCQYSDVDAVSYIDLTVCKKPEHLFHIRYTKPFEAVGALGK